MSLTPHIYLICILLFNISNATAINTCEIDEDLIELAMKNHLLMFGEIHGTQEMPAYFATVVCALSAKDQPIKVGIEHPLDQMPYIEQYINSNGTDRDKFSLVHNSYWGSSHQDGRTSMAMFNLVERIRQLRENGKDIKVFLFDDQTTANRESAMAEHVIAELDKDPGVLHLLITGNIHNQTAVGTPWDAAYKTMGVYLKAIHHEVVSINLVNTGGDAWLCTPDCKKTLFEIKDANLNISQLNPTTVNSKHQYQVETGVISTSYPARNSITEPESLD